MICAIHQPNYFPWPGWFYKLAHCDVFVILDTAQLSKPSYTNRVKIDGVEWLTVPVRGNGVPIKDAVVDDNLPWRRKHRKTIEQNYRGTPHFGAVMPVVDFALGAQEDRLGEINMLGIEAINQVLGIEGKVIARNDPAIPGANTELLVNICKAVGADTYLSGNGAASYQDVSMFERAGIGLTYSAYQPESLTDMGDKSILDAMFHIGPEHVMEVLRRG